MSNTNERPQEVINLQAGLQKLFSGLLPAAPSGTDVEKERNLLSRGIAALVLHKEADLTLKLACEMIVDGGGDGGIDAFYYNRSVKTLYLVQSKYFDSGTGIPSLGDVSKFASGVRSMVLGDLSAFARNQAIQKRRSEIDDLKLDSELKIVALLAYSGLNVLEEDQKRELNRLKDMFPQDDQVLSWKAINLSTLHDWITHQDEQQGVELVKLTIGRPGYLKQPHLMIYGKIALTAIKELYKAHGDALIAGNIRSFQGATEVNQAILETLKTTPERFLYLNNGITAYCGRIEMPPAVQVNHEVKEVTAHRFSIVNGAQTLGVIGQADDALLENGYVFIRIVSLERMEDDREFAKQITTTTNYQNQVQQRDLASVEPEQRVIAETLRPAGIRYYYKKVAGLWPHGTQSSFTSDEALVASACMQSFEQGELCAALYGNLDGLWKNDDGDAATGKPSSYQRVFTTHNSPRMIWRGVQAMRAVLDLEEEMAAEDAESGNLYTLRYARYLVLALVFQQLHPERGESIFVTEAEIETVRETAKEAYELVQQVVEQNCGKALNATFWGKGLDPEAKLRSIFGNASGCRTCWGKVMGLIHGKGKTEGK